MGYRSNGRPRSLSFAIPVPPVAPLLLYRPFAGIFYPPQQIISYQPQVPLVSRKEGHFVPPCLDICGWSGVAIVPILLTARGVPAMPSFPRYISTLALGFLILVIACTYPTTAAPTPTPTRPPAPTSRVLSAPLTRLPLPAPGLSNSKIVAAMKQTPGVLDAAISEQGNQVSLVLIVGPLTSESRGKELGDNFVRLFKSLSDDESPGQSIGRGKYDYLIGVYYPNKDKLVQGAKSRASDRISW